MLKNSLCAVNNSDNKSIVTTMWQDIGINKIVKFRIVVLPMTVKNLFIFSLN